MLRSSVWADGCNKVSCPSWFYLSKLRAKQKSEFEFTFCDIWRNLKELLKKKYKITKNQHLNEKESCLDVDFLPFLHIIEDRRR